MDYPATCHAKIMYVIIAPMWRIIQKDNPHYILNAETKIKENK